MHVLLLPMYYPEPGSPPHRGYMFYEQAMQLAAAGCRVGLAYVEQRLRKDMNFRTLRESHFQVTQEDNGSFVTLRMHAWNPKLSTPLGGKIWAHLACHVAGRYIRRFGKPDLVHAHFGTWAGYAARLVRERYGIPYVVTEHASSINAGQVTPVQADTLRKAYEGALRVLCVGSKLKRNVAPYLRSPSQAVLMPNFVDLDDFPPVRRHTRKEQRFTFVSVGNLCRRKGFDLLVDSFAQAFGSGHPHASLVIVGGGEEAERLRGQVHGLGLDGRVRLAGQLPRAEVAACLAQADAFVQASHAETFGIVFIEALATGMPAIGTVCGGPEDIITDECGYLVPPGDAVALARALRQMYDNYERFDPAAIRRSVEERFGSRQAGRRLVSLYEEALAEERRGR